MSPSKAIKVLERRRAFILAEVDKVRRSEVKRSYMLAEASALVLALEALEREVVAYRAVRAARYAAQQHISEASC